MKKISVLLVSFSLVTSLSFAKEREGNVTIKVNLNAPKEAKRVRLWLPYPVSDEHQRIEDVRIKGNYSLQGIYRDPATSALALYAEWQGRSDKRTLELSFKAWAEEWVAKELKETGEPIPVEVKRYLESNRWTPTDGKVREIATGITNGKKGILEKARAIYDWVVENTYRDPNVKGCGQGIVEEMLTKRGGKCVDISSVFVALARAAGVPAREIFGLRLGKKSKEDITGGHHCWAEFYLPGTGWVAVDPADVRKRMLEKGLDLKDAKPYREYYFGAVDEYRIVLGRGGRDVTLQPPQKGGALNYFMYPYAEVDDKPLDYMEPRSFRFSISFEAQ
ncbi:MAG: transglutaminase family protein [Candidatus Poribacteria bacterium]